jgi:hypothetical protein
VNRKHYPSACRGGCFDGQRDKITDEPGQGDEHRCLVMFCRRRKMTKNVGSLDRILRVIAGAVLIGLALYNPANWWGWIGIVPLVTAFIGWCPAYRLLGMRTCPVEKRA